MRAGRIRDEIKALTSLGARAKKGEQEYWQPEAYVTSPEEAVAALQEALGLVEAPRILEAIDIAHLQGGEMVGSKVCFIDGKPLLPISKQTRLYDRYLQRLEDVREGKAPLGTK